MGFFDKIDNVSGSNIIKNVTVYMHPYKNFLVSKISHSYTSKPKQRITVVVCVHQNDITPCN